MTYTAFAQVNYDPKSLVHAHTFGNHISVQKELQNSRHIYEVIHSKNYKAPSTLNSRVHYNNCTLPQFAWHYCGLQ